MAMVLDEPMRNHHRRQRAWVSRSRRQYLEAGASVMICARDEALLRRRPQRAEQAGAGRPVGGRAARRCLQGRGCARGSVDAALAQFGRLDILVNNAGVVGPSGRSRGRLAGMGARDRDQSAGFGAACRAVLPHFKRRRTEKSSSCRAAAPRTRCRT